MWAKGERKLIMGRPTQDKRDEMDEKARDLVPKLAAIGCTYDEIATVTGIDRSTIIRKYSDLYHEGRNNLKIGLRRKALKRADTSDAILRKLLEQYLEDMKEETTVNINNNSKDKLDKIDDEDLVEIMVQSGGKVQPINKK